MNTTGASIGVFVGIISGLITLIILKTLIERPLGNIKTIMSLLAELAGLCGVVFSVKFLDRSPFFIDKDIVAMKDTYALFLTLTFLIILIYPVFRWIMRLGKEFGETNGG